LSWIIFFDRKMCVVFYEGMAFAYFK